MDNQIVAWTFRCYFSVYGCSLSFRKAFTILHTYIVKFGRRTRLTMNCCRRALRREWKKEGFVDTVVGTTSTDFGTPSYWSTGDSLRPRHQYCWLANDYFFAGLLYVKNWRRNGVTVGAKEWIKRALEGKEEIWEGSTTRQKSLALEEYINQEYKSVGNIAMKQFYSIIQQHSIFLSFRFICKLYFIYVPWIVSAFATVDEINTVPQQANAAIA